MDIQGLGHRLHLHPGHVAELHRGQLELDAVAVNRLRSNRFGHSTPPSVSRKCLLYRGRFTVCSAAKVGVRAMIASALHCRAAWGTALRAEERHLKLWEPMADRAPVTHERPGGEDD